LELNDERFQKFIADQFTKLFSECSGLKEDVSGLKQDVAIIKIELGELKDSQVRMESKFRNQITALHDLGLVRKK